MIEPDEIIHHETNRGTPYQIVRWTCPECKQSKSHIEIDGEWCHGDSEAASFGAGGNWEGCLTCAVAREKRKRTQ